MSPGGTAEAGRMDAYVVATNWCVNACPLVTRTPRVPAAGWAFETAGGVAQHTQPFREAASPDDDTDAGWPTGPFGPGRTRALERLVDAMERSAYYGEGPHPRWPEQLGLRALLRTNRFSPPGGPGVAGPGLLPGALRACREAGGDPDVVIVSPEFVAGFGAWGGPLRRSDAGVNVFGHEIDCFETDLLPGVTVLSTSRLRPGDAVALTSGGVRMRMLANEHWVPTRFAGGGDWAAEGAVDVDREAHHAWVEGVRGFAS